MIKFPALMVGMLLSAALVRPCFASEEVGFVNSSGEHNKALIVGVPHNLKGIDIDMKNMSELLKLPEYGFQASPLWSKDATADKMMNDLTDVSANVEEHGTFLFYFSGHGLRGSINAQDRSLKIAEIRQSIEDGRKGQGALERLVIIFDSCFSGSLLSPLGFGGGLITEAEGLATAGSLADDVLQEFAPSKQERANYWTKLFVFASSRENETSMASAKGSEFTLGFKRALEETMKSKATLNELVQKAKGYTYKHHPEARFDPESFGTESLF